MQVGKRYEITTSGRKGQHNRIVGTVVGEYDRFYLFKTKNYTTSINKLNFYCGHYSAKPI